MAFVGTVFRVFMGTLQTLLTWVHVVNIHNPQLNSKIVFNFLGARHQHGNGFLLDFFVIPDKVVDVEIRLNLLFLCIFLQHGASFPFFFLSIQFGTVIFARRRRRRQCQMRMCCCAAKSGLDSKARPSSFSFHFRIQINLCKLRVVERAKNAHEKECPILRVSVLVLLDGCKFDKSFCHRIKEGKNANRKSIQNICVAPHTNNK